jgi:hypothetical protein
VLAQRAASEGPRLGILARLGVPVGGRVRKLRAVGDSSEPSQGQCTRASLEGSFLGHSLRPCWTAILSILSYLGLRIVGIVGKNSDINWVQTGEYFSNLCLKANPSAAGHFSFRSACASQELGRIAMDTRDSGAMSTGHGLCSNCGRWHQCQNTGVNVCFKRRGL